MKHTLKVLHMDKAPTATCSCGKWGYVMTRTKGDNDSSICWALAEAHRQHAEENKLKPKGNKDHDTTTRIHRKTN